MKYGSQLIAVLFLTAPAAAQNLVPNPGFEELIRCPHSFSTNSKDFIVPGWSSPTRGTPDLFHACSWGEADVPYNWAGSSTARSGKGYAGIYVWMKREDNTHYREYIQCELAEPLRPGKRYALEFCFKLSSYSVYAANRIGMLLSDSIIHAGHDQVLKISPILSVEKDSPVSGTTGSWEVARTEITARGGERYVVIGNFFDNEQTQSTRLPHRIGKSKMLTTGAYFYIDDVSVIPLDAEPPADARNLKPFDAEGVEFNRIYVLTNIRFEFDSYVLMQSSFEELDKVVRVLNAFGDVSVWLSGHTDFIGSDEYNLKLSRERSRSVADYLISKGIDPVRITTYGFGKSRPLVTEKTDEARSINRRVEIKFIN